MVGSVKSQLVAASVNSLIRKNKTRSDDPYNLGFGGDVDTQSGRIKTESEYLSNLDVVGVLNSNPCANESRFKVGDGPKCHFNSHGMWHC